MKKYIAFFALATALLTAGCSLDRIPLTGPSTGTFPASFDEAQAGVLAAYKSLANNIEQYEPFPNRWMDQLTDIGAMRTVLSKWPDYTQSTITSSYSGVEHFYARIYKSLGRIHLVLDASRRSFSVCGPISTTGPAKSTATFRSSTTASRSTTTPTPAPRKRR